MFTRRDMLEFTKKYLDNEKQCCYNVKLCGPDCPFFRGVVRFEEPCDYEKVAVRRERRSVKINGKKVECEVLDGNKKYIELRDINKNIYRISPDTLETNEIS